MKTLYYDTETTSFPLWREPSEDPRQPHLTQVAAFLTDDDGKKMGSIDLLVDPEGWSIPEDVQRLTGITEERAAAGGVPECVALAAFIALWARADIRVAHNESFDARIIRIALHRYSGIFDPDIWSEGAAECTMRLATPLLKLPATEKMVAAGRANSFKAPNLSEAHMGLLGREMSGAHNAMFDVIACMAIHKEIKRRLDNPVAAAVAGVICAALTEAV